MKIKVMYENIDSWNRPVFRELRKKAGDKKPRRRFGTMFALFPYGEPEAEVLKQIKSEHLVFFGSEFDCEPMGTSCDVEIVKEADVPLELV